MRIERLSITGFGPFRERQVIDFARFDGDLFLITGKTGAGKSSILDAICFAFYGDIPRYEKTDSALRSDYCQPEDPTVVELEFSLGADRYRIVRSPEYLRPAKRGGGMTSQGARATLERFDGDRFSAKTAALRETNIAIGGILGLTKPQFLQVILLAQGRFQEFLKASSDDRLGVLRSLFETTRFERLERKLDDRRRELEGGIAAARDTSARQRGEALAILKAEDAPEHPNAQWYVEQLGGLAEVVKKTVDAAAAAETARASADAELGRLRTIERRQRERAAATERLASLAAKADALAADRSALEADKRGAPIAPQLTVQREATALVVAAEAALAAAAADPDLGTPPPTDAAAASAAQRESDSELGALTTALAEESTLPALRSELAKAEQDVAAAATAIEAGRARLEALPAAIAATNDDLRRLGAVAALEPAARATLETEQTRLEAATAALAKRNDVADQIDEVLRVSTLASAASAAHSALLHRQLAGYAGVLASALVAGSPCPVCGSSEHPAPAESDDSTVTQDDVDEARAVMDRRRDQLARATTRKSELDAELAVLRAGSAGKSVDELTVDLDRARSELETAHAAATSAARKTAELGELETERAAASTESARLAADLEARRSIRDVLATRASDLDSRLVGARGDFDTVAARSEALRVRAAALATFRTASERLDQARLAENRAGRLVGSLLGKHGFERASDVEATQLTAADRARLTERVARHNSEVDAAAGVLATLVGVPDGAVDLDASVDTMAIASALRDETRDASVAALRAQAELASLIDAVRAYEANNSTLLDEFELVRQLAAAVAGKTPNTKLMRLETYVLAAELEDIVDAANQRLTAMTSGRYVLQHDDKITYGKARGGLGLEILDQYSGRVRPTHSLSGGETFLASLALALGLAEVVSSRSGAVRLDTLFIDEGFGSLDADTLELAMTTLDGLRAGGRTIGIISHVEAMKEQIPTQLRVDVRDSGDSRVRTA